MASNISSSGTSFAPASTIIMAESVPATAKSISESFFSSSFGSIINLPFTLPTYTPATGPSKGISEIHKAKEAPNIPVISGVLSGSTDITVDTN